MGNHVITINGDNVDRPYHPYPESYDPLGGPPRVTTLQGRIVEQDPLGSHPDEDHPDEDPPQDEGAQAEPEDKHSPAVPPVFDEPFRVSTQIKSFVPSHKAGIGAPVASAFRAGPSHEVVKDPFVGGSFGQALTPLVTDNSLDQLFTPFEDNSLDYPTVAYI